MEAKAKAALSPRWAPTTLPVSVRMAAKSQPSESTSWASAAEGLGAPLAAGWSSVHSPSRKTHTFATPGADAMMRGATSWAGFAGPVEGRGSTGTGDGLEGGPSASRMSRRPKVRRSS